MQYGPLDCAFCNGLRHDAAAKSALLWIFKQQRSRTLEYDSWVFQQLQTYNV